MRRIGDHRCRAPASARTPRGQGAVRTVPVKNTPAFSCAKPTPLQTWMRAAEVALAPPAEVKPTTLAPPNPARLQRDLKLFETLLHPDPENERERHFADYSAEELRRVLVVQNPHLTRAYFEQHVRPKLTLNRPIDRMGDEPRLLVAAHLASAFLYAPVGESVEQTLDVFRKIRLSPGVENELWSRWFTMADVERLRVMYPFIPPPGMQRPQAPDLRLEHVLKRLQEVSEIPLTTMPVRQLRQARPFDKGRLSGARMVEVGPSLADKISYFNELIAFDGMRGKDITLVSKGYSSDPVVADVMRRCYGVKVDIKVGDDVDAAAIAALEKSASECAPGEKLLIHIEGIHVWPHIRAVQERHPHVQMAAVSHTTSDGRDLETPMGQAFPMPVTMMSLSDAKENDERERFRRSLASLTFKVAEALDCPLYERRFAVMGYGKIMGPAAGMALRDLQLDYVIVDPDPQARARALADGIPAERIKDSLDTELDRQLVVYNCAAVDTVSAEQIRNMEQANIFINLGSGRAGFSMKALEERCADPLGIPRTAVAGWVGHQPAVQYIEPGMYQFHTFVADGYVANLAYPRPNITTYSGLTNMLVIESLREASWRAERDDNGLQTLQSVQIENAVREKPGRELRFFRRGEVQDEANLRFLIDGKRATREQMWKSMPDASFAIVFSEAVVEDISESIFPGLLRKE